MLVTDDGIVTETSELQDWKTPISMVVIDDGIVTDIRELQDWKAQ